MLTRPTTHMRQHDSDSDDDACDDCVDGNCGTCVDIEEEQLKSGCTKCCVGYVVVCSFNALFIHSLLAGLCIGLIAGALARSPPRLAVLEMIMGEEPCNGRLAQDILLAAGIIGVIFLILYVPVRCFGLKSAKCQVAMDLTFMLVLLSLTAAAGFLGVASRDEAFYYYAPLERYVREIYESFDAGADVWEKAQIGYRCCGATGPWDYYQNSTWYLSNSSAVPLSCCRRSSKGELLSESVCQSTAYSIQTGAVTDLSDPLFVYTKSCNKELLAAFDLYTAQIIGISFSMVLFEACGICFAVYIYFIRNRRSVNPADRYRVEEKPEDRLFTRRDSSLPYGPDRTEKPLPQATANGTAGRAHNEPVPGTSTGGETPTRNSTGEERRISGMFAANNAASGPSFISESTKTDSEIRDMFKADKPDQTEAEPRAEGVFEPRSGSRSDDRGRDVFEERMDMFTASSEKGKQPKRVDKTDSVENGPEGGEGTPGIPGETDFKHPNGTVDIDGVDEQESTT